MNNRKNVVFLSLLIIFVLTILLNSGICAGNSLKENIDKIIGSSPITRTALVAVSIRDVKTGQIVYQRFGDYYLHTASVLKSLTTPVVLSTLGEDYKITTSLTYAADTGNAFVKLSGDPLLTSTDLVDLVREAKEKGLTEITRDIILDGNIIDDINWGVGWLWDDENNSLMPKYNAYNIDHNVITVRAVPDQFNKPACITLIPTCDFAIVNNTVTCNQTDVTIERKPWKGPETIFVSGKIGSVVQKELPVGSPENYFICRLINALNVNKVKFNGRVLFGNYPPHYKPLAQVSHNLLEVVTQTNQQSDNMAAETIFKLAGAKYAGKTGSTKNGVAALTDFYSKIGANPGAQEIADASGASQNDLLQPNWITLAYTKLCSQPFYAKYKNSLAKPGGSGTLYHRLKKHTGRFWGKTGTLSGVSSLSGYLQGKSGKTYAVAIMVQNFKGPSLPAKTLENEIINTLSNY